MNKTEIALMSYGIDSGSVGKIAENHTLSQLKSRDKNYLLELGIPEYIADRLLLPSARTPIPQKTADELLRRSAFTCCVCKNPELSVVIHHIVRWEQSRSHDIENLAVLCLNHHDKAHTHHELSQNLTPNRIRGARNEWFGIIEQRGNQARDDAFGNLQRYQGRWDYFNISYIYQLLFDHNISFSSRYKQSLLNKNLLNEDRIINADKLATNSTHWLNFYDGMLIKGFVEDMVNAIINTLEVKYLSNSIYTQKSLAPGDFCLMDGNFSFKMLSKQKKGIGQMRKATCKINGIEYTGQFDAWYCNSSSSHGLHLTGRKEATQLFLVRDIMSDGNVAQVSGTIIGIGLNLTKPDIMSQLMGNLNRTSYETLNQTNEYELDQLADFERGIEYNHYFLPRPERCYICKTSLVNKKYIIDGKVKHQSAWALMCSDCYHVRGVGIGYGVGQLYCNKDNQWLMVGGFDDSDDEMDDETPWQLFDDFTGNSK